MAETRDFKVALINPRDSSIPLEDYAVYENLGLALLAAYLRQHGYPVKIIDGYADDLSDSIVVQQTIEFRPHLVGFTCTYQTYDAVLAIAAAVRQHLPTVHCTLGGEHATYTAHEVLTASCLIDSVVRGEGEATLLDLVTAIESNRPLTSVQGLSFRSSGVVIENPNRAAITDLDALPFAARDTLKATVASGKSILIGMLASRGCYSKCSFCNANRFFRLGGGKVLRKRSPQNIVTEIATLYEEYVLELLSQGVDVS